MLNETLPYSKKYSNAISDVKIFVDDNCFRQLQIISNYTLKPNYFLF